MSSQQFCTFLLDGTIFGVPVPQVQEVILFQQMTHVPLAPAIVEGMINLRGQIVIAVDLRRKLALPERPPGQVPMNVVVRASEGAVSLLVDEIGDVIEVSESSFERPPETLQGPVRTMILGVHKLNGQLLHVLDTNKACEVHEESEESVAQLATQ